MGALDDGTVEGLNMKVGFGAVSRVPAATDVIPGNDPLTGTDRDAALLKMTQGDDGGSAVNEDVIPGECLPARGGSTPLG